MEISSNATNQTELRRIPTVWQSLMTSGPRAYKDLSEQDTDMLLKQLKTQVNACRNKHTHKGKK